MNKSQKYILRKNRLALVQDLEPRIVVNFLYQDEIFSENDLEVVNSLSTRQDKAEKILDTLPRRGPKAFDAFYEALNSNETQRHLADFLYPKSPTQETSRPGVSTASSARPPVYVAPGVSTASSARPPVAPSDRPSDPLEETEGAFARLEIAGRPSIHHDHPLPSTTTTVDQDSDVYRMNSSHHGLCLIINNANFEADSGLNNRKGSNIDARNLQSLFTTLDYKVTLVENVRARKLRDIVFKFAKEDHKKSDSVIVCILSHGLEGKVYGVDGGLVTIEDIVTMFKGINVKELIGKPKLFFIQACRGGDFDRGINLEKVDSATAPIEEKKAEELLAELYPDDDQADGGFLSQQSLPSDSDILIAYSTVPGYVSWRNQEEGSWFVQALVDVFKNYSSSEDVVSMIIKVNRKVALDFESSTKKKQMPAPVIMLTRKLFFYPQS